MFDHLRHRAIRPTTESSSTPTMAAPLTKPEDGLDNLCLSDTHTIEVEEINPVEFVREWGRAVTKAALAHSSEKHIDKDE
jgi:hypothetical protein